MNKHTPTPWKEGTRGPNNCPVIGNEQGLMVCMVNTGVNFQNEADANAAHIVRCVNSHDALVKALHVIKSQSVGADWTAEQALAFIKQHASEALAAAGAQQ